MWIEEILAAIAVAAAAFLVGDACLLACCIVDCLFMILRSVSTHARITSIAVVVAVVDVSIN